MAVGEIVPTIIRSNIMVMVKEAWVKKAGRASPKIFLV